MIAIEYINKGLTRSECLAVCGISKHDLYYKPLSGKVGRKGSLMTKKLENGVWVEVANEVVVAAIKDRLKDPLCDYGHRKMESELQHIGYLINHKKVFRLMALHRLLKQRIVKPKKNYAQYRILTPEAPLTLIEMDIKQIWLSAEQKKAFILTLIDVFTRVTLHWRVGYYMRQEEVEESLSALIEDHLIPHQTFSWEISIEIRSDNGPQFCANSIINFMAQNGFNQTFTHPYTPQENGHIESFHSILSSAIQFENFKDLDQLTKRLEIFYDNYNERRLHGSIANLPPNVFWRLWVKNLITRKVKVKKGNRKDVTFKLRIPRYEVHLHGRQSELEALSRLIS